MLTEYGYLVAAANEMHVAYIRRNDPSNNLADAAGLGCDTLRELLQDEAFFSDITMLGEMLRNNRVQVDAIVGIEASLAPVPGELSAFQNFLNAEKRILIAGGMERDLVEALMEEANRLIDRIRVEQLDPETMRAKVKELRRIACKVADSLRRQQNLGVLWSNFWKLTVAVGGCAIVGLNASSVLATIGLSAPGAAISGAIGSALVGVGTTLVIEDVFD